MNDQFSYQEEVKHCCCENMSFIQTHLMVILPGAGLATNAIQVELGGNWFSTNKLGENGGYQNLRARRGFNSREV